MSVFMWGKRIFIGIVSLCFLLNAKAQESEEIVGQIIDQKLKFPVVFATVQLQKEESGVVADENGYFRIPANHLSTDEILRISAIGYETKTLQFKTLSTHKINTIFLTPRVESLNEVVLKPGNTKSTKLSAEGIVKKAIQNIGVNYPRQAFSYIGYYRDYQLLNNQYTNLNEGIVEVFDGGFATDQLTDSINQTLLYSFRTNTNFITDSTVAVPYGSDNKFIKHSSISPLGGNELSLLNLHDPIRNNKRKTFSFIYKLRENFVAHHDFELSNIHYLDDTPLYEITFNAKKEVTGVQNSAHGTLYISKSNYAIHKLSYLGYVVNERDPLFSVTLEYAKKGAHMYLNYISFNNFFQVKSKDDFSMKDIEFDASLNAFYISFNNAVNKDNATNKKNYKFILNKRKLNIDKIVLKEPNMVKISLVQGTVPKNTEVNEEWMRSIKYRFKNITDIANRKLNRTTLIGAHQFRELFVQKVFPNKPLPPDQKSYVLKTSPLSESEINANSKAKKYWVNTPLKVSNR